MTLNDEIICKSNESNEQTSFPGWCAFELCDASKLNCRVCLGEGGQSFTWETLDPLTWYNVIDGHCVIIRLDESKGKVILFLPENTSKSGQLEAALSAVKDYLRLGEDLEDLCLKWQKSDPKFPLNYLGIRLLRQDPLETLFAFICSQNNLIPRIKQLVKTLKRRYGSLKGKFSFPSHFDECVEFYEFPRNVSVFEDSESVLRELKFGYRAKYISSAAGFLRENDFFTSADLCKFRSKNYGETVDFLRQIPGIGPKVADCIALMSLDQLSSVPIDTHIWRIARERYKFTPSKQVANLNDRIYREIGDKFRQLFGEKAGWAHSILFTAELKPFKNKILKK